MRAHAHAHKRKPAKPRTGFDFLKQRTLNTATGDQGGTYIKHGYDGTGAIALHRPGFGPGSAIGAGARWSGGAGGGGSGGFARPKKKRRANGRKQQAAPQNAGISKWLRPD